MDDLEFRKKAIIEPDNQDPNFLNKTSQNDNNSRFVENQQSFNKSLKDTLEIPTPENLNERIILAQQLSQRSQKNEQAQHQGKTTRHKQWRNWLGGSIAASIAVFMSLILILPKTMDSSVLAKEVISHIYEDTHALDVQMNVPKNNIDTMLTSYGGKLKGPIGQVTYLGHCIVGGQTGIHMVLNTSQGIVTVLLLPKQSINDSILLSDNQLNGILYPSQKGSIAIVSEHAAAIEQTRQQINQNLNWII